MKWKKINESSYADSYANKKFKDLPCDLITYNGKRWKSWEVNCGDDYGILTFADIKLLNELEENGDSGNWIDDKIAWYVSPSDSVEESILEFKD